MGCNNLIKSEKDFGDVTLSINDKADRKFLKFGNNFNVVTLASDDKTDKFKVWK